MKKKQKQILALVGVIGAVIILFLYFKPTSSTLAIPQGCYGNILNIDKVDVDIGQGFTKPYVKVDILAGQGADCLLIAWTKAQLESALKRGDSETKSYTATKDLLDFGYIKLDKYEKTWQIIPITGSYENDNNFKLNKDHFCQSDFSWVTCTTSDCQSRLGDPGSGSWIYAVGSNNDDVCGWTENKCLCISKAPVVQKGRWSSASTSYRQATVSISGLNPVTLSGEQTIPSAVINDAYGNRKVLIQWGGDLYAGLDIGSPTGHMPLYDKRSGQGIWHFQDNAVWDYMKSNFDDYFYVVKAQGRDEEAIDQFIEGLGNSFTPYLIRNEPAYIEEYKRQEMYVTDVVLNKAGSLSDASLTIDLTNNPPTYPLFSIYLEAEWVGIKKAVTKPRIVCNQQSVQFNSGMTSDVGITVYNDADIGGQIDTEVNCDNGGSIFISPASYQINKQSSATGIVRIGGIADGLADKTGTCTINVLDHTDPSITSSCNIAFTVKALQCTAGDRKCSPDLTQLWSCSGNQWSIQECPYGCTYEGSVPICASSPNPQCPTSCDQTSECEPCGEKDEYKCFNKRCMKESASMECPSCFSWLYSKVKKGYCIPKVVYEIKLGDIIGWHIGPSIIRIDQDKSCPVVTSVIVVIVLTILLLFIGIIMALKRRKKRR